MTVLLTGAASFVGSQVLARLHRHGVAVVGCYRRESPHLQRLRLEMPDIRLVAGDLADGDFYRQLPARIRAIAHFAAASSESQLLSDLVASNVDGTTNVVRYAERAGATCMVLASSLSVHGRVSVGTVDPATPIVDPGTYGLTKRLSELIVADCGLPGVAMRFPGVLGPEAARHWLARTLQSLRTGEPVTIVNPDARFNNAAHVDDIANFVHSIVEAPPQGFHMVPVGAKGTLAIAEVVAHLQACTQSRSTVHVGVAQSNPFLISSDAAMALGYRPMDLTQMLTRFAEENSR